MKKNKLLFWTSWVLGVFGVFILVVGSVYLTNVYPKIPRGWYLVGGMVIIACGAMCRILSEEEPIMNDVVY